MTDRDIDSDEAAARAGQPDPDHRLAAAEDADGLAFPLGRVPEPREACEVAPGILLLRMPLPWSLDHINLYALADGDGWTVVDCGIRSKHSMQIWQDWLNGPLGGRPLRRIIATHHHPDHIGLAAWLAARFGLTIHASRAAWLTARTLALDIGAEPPEEVLAFSRRAGLSDAMIAAQREAGWGNYARLVAPLPVGYRRIDGGETIRIGDDDWRAIETAGHAPGHISLWCAARGLLISGDQLLPLISSNVSVHPTEPAGDPLAEWLEGLARLRVLPDDTLVLPSHNVPFTGLGPRLDALIGKHVTRMAAVVQMCENAPCAAVDVFPALFRRRVSGMEYMMATGEALAHLHFLEAACVLAREETDGVARFRAVSGYDIDAVHARLDAVTARARERGPWRA